MRRIYRLFFRSKKSIFKQRLTIKKILPYLFPIIFAFQSGFGQDIHFSQFDGSLLNLSPGFTGLFNGDYRVGAIYRSQWQTVPVKYSTISVAGEARIKPQGFSKDMIGIGLMFNSDRSGDARYGSTQIYASGSYIFLGKPDSTLLITLGMNLGWCQVGFDYSKMTFNNQFDGLQYNQTLGTGENFDYTRYNYVDLNLGAAMQYIINPKNRISYGLGLYHLTNPVISFTGNQASRLDFKLTNYLSYATPINLHTDFIAEALITTQGRNYELIPNASLKYYMSRALNQSVLGGLCFRARDAAIVRFGYSYRTLQSGIAYDINISKFNAASNRRGAFEIFVNYVFRRKYSYTAKKRVCPVFM